jgi:CRP-like cAMP-binding protein
MMDPSTVVSAICLRCSSRPESTEALPNPLPSKEWWKLIMDITEQNRRSCEQESTKLQRSLEEALMTIMKCAGEQSMYSKGQILLKEGDVNSTMYLIESGLCEVSIMLGAVKTAKGIDGGVPTVVAKLSTDDILGEISFILGCQASATVTVASHGAALRKIDMKTCEQLLKKGGFKAKDLLLQIAFKLAGKLVISNNTKLAQLKLQKERQERAMLALEMQSDAVKAQKKLEQQGKEIKPVESLASIRLTTYKKMFDKYDKDSKGHVSASECRLILSDCGVECTSEILETMIDRYDSDGSGEIEFNEFLRMIEGISASAAQVSPLTLWKSCFG